MENLQEKAPATSPAQSKTGQFPSIPSTFSNAWAIFKKCIVNLIILAIISNLVSLFVLAMGGVAAFFSAPKVSLSDFATAEGFFQYFSNLGVFPWLFLGLAFVAVAVIRLLFTIATIIIVGETDKETDIGQALAKAPSVIFPLIAVGLLSSFLTIGSFFVLFLPALLVFFFLMFAQFEAALARKGPLESIKGSVQIVSQFFGEILIRMLALYGIFFLFFMLFPGVLNQILPSYVSVYFNLFLGILQIISGWFFLTYSIALYRQAQQRLDPNKPAKTWWIWVVALFGWFLVVSIGAAAFAHFKSKGTLENLKKSFSDFETTEIELDERIGYMVPSNCGLSLPLPNTTHGAGDDFRKWMYEERPLTANSFYVLGNDYGDTHPVLGNYVSFKSERQKIQNQTKTGTSFNISFPGWNVSCVENTDDLSLDEFIQTALDNQDFKVTKKTEVETWGDLQVQLVNIEGVMEDGNFISEPAYLAIGGKGERLLHIRLWKPMSDDPVKDELIKDLEEIEAQVEDREIDQPLIETPVESAPPRRNFNQASSRPLMYSVQHQRGRIRQQQVLLQVRL